MKRERLNTAMASVALLVSMVALGLQAKAYIDGRPKLAFAQIDHPSLHLTPMGLIYETRMSLSNISTQDMVISTVQVTNLMRNDGDPVSIGRLYIDGEEYQRRPFTLRSRESLEITASHLRLTREDILDPYVDAVSHAIQNFSDPSQFAEQLPIPEGQARGILSRTWWEGGGEVSVANAACDFALINYPVICAQVTIYTADGAVLSSDPKMSGLLPRSIMHLPEN